VTLRRPWTIAETPYPRKTFRLPKVLSVEQVSQLIHAASTLFYRVLLMTLYATGLRRAELAHLKMSDVDKERMVIHVKGGKGRKDREVMLSPKRLQELECYLGGLSPDRTHWVLSQQRFFLPVAVLAEVFRGKFTEALEEAFAHGKLGFHGSLKPLERPRVFAQLIRQTFRKNGWSIRSLRLANRNRHSAISAATPIAWRSRTIDLSSLPTIE
jgi:integrase